MRLCDLIIIIGEFNLLGYNSHVLLWASESLYPIQKVTSMAPYHFFFLSEEESYAVFVFLYLFSLDSVILPFLVKVF